MTIYLLKLLTDHLIQLILSFIEPIVFKWYINIHKTIALIINQLGFIRALLLFLNIIEFIFKYIIFAFIFFSYNCAIVLYIYADFYIYLSFFIGISILLIGICFLFFSVKFLIKAIEAILNGNFFLFKLNFILFIVSLFTAIILILYGLHTLHIIPWSDMSLRVQAKPLFDHGNNGTGNGSGGGGGNYDPSGLGTASQQDSKDETERKRRMYIRKEQSLLYHKDLYTKTWYKANKNLKNLRNQKRRKSKNGHIDTTYDQEIQRNVEIREAVKLRLSHIKVWLTWHRENK